MYTLGEYGQMLGDRARIGAYERALGEAIRPGSLVLDIGAGAGILSLIACRLGAGRVIAVEPAPAIHVARELAAANGFADRIEFIQGLSTDVTLDTRADLIVSDMRGVLPFHQQHLPSVADARARLLAPGGVLIPQQDTVWAAPVEAADIYAPFVSPWTEGACGLDLRPAQSFATNAWIRTRLAPAHLLTAAQPWVTIDYRNHRSPDAHGEMRFTIERPGILHGTGAWFSTHLGSGVRFSSAPGEPELVYAQAFFPLPSPVAVASGDAVLIDLRADLVGDDYVWRWFTRVLEQGSPDRVTASHRQSTFLGEPLSGASLRKRAAGFVPRPGIDAAIDGLILSLMDGQAASADIARAVMARFPSRYSTWEEALARVGRLAVEYSE